MLVTVTMTMMVSKMSVTIVPKSQIMSRQTVMVCACAHFMLYLWCQKALYFAVQRERTIALFTGDGTGDACENDCDGDGVVDSEDTAPCNKFLTKDSLDQFMVVKLSNPVESQADWVVQKSGTYVVQTKSSDPELLLGKCCTVCLVCVCMPNLHCLISHAVSSAFTRFPCLLIIRV